MKNFIFFEKVLYTRSLDKTFFWYCFFRQPTLIKYLFSRLFYGILNVFGLVHEEKFFSKRWEFLRAVNDPDRRVGTFWFSRFRRIHALLSNKSNLWISRYPEPVLAPLALDYDAQLFANPYNLEEGRFLFFRGYDELYKMAARSVKPAFIVDSARKTVNTGADTIFAYNGRTFKSSASCRRYMAFYAIYTALTLLCLSAGLSFISLYFTASTFSRDMLDHYLAHPLLLLLNTLPLVFLIILLYLAFNRVWLSFLLSSAITFLFTLVNYFKLCLRDDPFMASDVSLFFEANSIVRGYEIVYEHRMIITAAFFLLLTLALTLTSRGRIASARVRLGAFVITLCAAVFLYFTVYTNDSIYSKTENLDLISQWSATQQYVSRGFFYPFLYSVKNASPKPPPGYNPTQAADWLSDFKSEDIPDNQKVNIIAIMCESFNDFTKFNKLEFAEDVYGPYHDLKKRSYSGELITNIFAGGTTDTEWAFLTGFSVLNEFRAPVNSYVHYLKNQGYYTEGSHPSYNWFYNRRNVNSYLGFDNYYYSENRYTELSGINVAYDDILFPEIIKLFEQHVETSTEPYFSFNVTYQNHGPYSDVTAYYDKDYIVDKGYSQETFLTLNNYFMGIANTVENIVSMADYFESRAEPVIFVVFGDHNPGLGYANSAYDELGITFDFSMQRGFMDYYSVPYLIFVNEAAKRVFYKDFAGDGPTISPCFLMNELFSLLGWGGNEFMKASAAVREASPMLHSGGYFLDDGDLTRNLPEDKRAAVDRFLKMQYYWRWNFKDN